MRRKGLVPLQVYLPDEIHYQLKKAAVEERKDMTEMVKRLIMRYLQEENSKNHQ